MTSSKDDDFVLNKAEHFALEAVDLPLFIPEYKHWTAEAVKREGPFGRKGNYKMTQTEKIIKYMQKNGSISMRDALLDLGVQALPRRIADLREQGWKIKSEWRTNKAAGSQFKRYYLDEG